MDETDFLNRRLGQTLRGKWTLERLLGWGGMAAVYVGLHHIGRRDAIKILHEEVAVAPDIRARFEQEAHAVNHLRHPGVVEVRDIDVTDDGCPFLVMELLEGESLASVLGKQERLDPSLLLQYVDEVLDVLVAAHAGGIIHRDIKPDNLFLCTSGRIKVLDFGVARMKEGAPRTLATRTGMAVGTLTYMAPEQVRGVHVDARADVFALGATLFRCIARRRIHDGATEADLLIKMATMPAPPLRTVVPEVSVDLALVVDRALQFDTAHRYPDAATMQADVRALMRGERPPFAISAPAVVPATIPGTIPATTPATIPATIPGGAPSGAAGSVPLAGGELPTRAEVPRPAAPVEPTASSGLQQAPAVEPTLVEAASAVSMLESRDQRNKGPILALILGALGAVFLLVLGVGAVAWWAFSGDDSSTGVVSASSAPAATREITTLFGDTSSETDTGTTATRGVPPAGGQPPSATLPLATTLPPTSTATLPSTTTLPPPATTTTLPPTTTSPLATLLPPLPTGTAPATTPPQPSIPTATAPPGTSPPPKDDKEKDKGKGKGKGKDKGKGNDR